MLTLVPLKMNGKNKILQGASPCRERINPPPVSSVASVAEFLNLRANKMDEAYTENRIDRRGVRAPLSVDIASK